MTKRLDTDPLPNPAERNKHWKRVGENKWREIGDDEALSRRFKGFDIKRDKPTKKGTGFTMMIHKKIKGFEEETDMTEKSEEGGEQVVQEPNVSDLVVHAIDQKPLDFQQSFADLMQQRIADSVYEKKLEIAAGFAGANTEPSDDEYDEEPGDDDSDWNGTEYEEEEEEDLEPGEPEEE